MIQLQKQSAEFLSSLFSFLFPHTNFLDQQGLAYSLKYRKAAEYSCLKSKLQEILFIFFISNSLPAPWPN